jgi:hypothetical protein
MVRTSSHLWRMVIPFSAPMKKLTKVGFFVGVKMVDKEFVQFLTECEP